MEFLLLGTLMVRSGETQIPIKAAKQRALLAALLLRANRVVSVDELTEVLWDDEPPPSARPTLHNYVKRLRQALGDADRSRITTRPPGYQAIVGPGELDVTRFEALQRSAQDAAQNRSWERAASQLRMALALWRGPPLSDIPSLVLAARETVRLSEMRLQALEARIDADLYLGRSGELIPEIAALAAAHPLREGFHARLMLALYREGRQGEALAAYRHARQILIAELGLEPGPSLWDLHQRMLAADPGLVIPPQTGPAELSAAGRTRSVVPRQLPATVPHFVGRRNQLAVLGSLLEQDPRTESPTAVAAIIGSAGVGKTALAVHFAHHATPRFPDGQLYVNLRGFDPSGTPVSPGEAIAGFLDALNVLPERIPAGLEAQAALYRSLLADQRMLIVLDNARDAGHVRPLLPSSPTCLVVVTSRSLLTSLAAVDGARLISLDVLSEPEAREFLVRRLGDQQVAADDGAVTDLAVQCARLPLALAIAAAHVAARPNLPLDALAAQLRNASDRLDALNTGEETSDIRAVFSWSYRQLSSPAARMFRLLGLHPGPDISVPAVASLTALAPAEARLALEELARAHLLTEHLPNRFTFHDLLRAYAAERAAAEDDESGRSAARGRILDHYLHTSHAGSLLLNTGREPLSLSAACPGTRPEPLNCHKQALQWFTAEQAVLLSAVPYAAGTGFGRHAWQLSWAAETFLAGRGHWREYAALQRTALAAAQRLHDSTGMAYAHRGLAFALLHLGSYHDAHAHYQQALEKSHDDVTGQAAAHVGIGMVFEQQKMYRPALIHSELALDLYQTLGNRSRQARALNNAGWCHAGLGDYARAISCCEAALALHRELGDDWGEAAALDSLGYAHHHLGQDAQAASCYRQAISKFRDLGYRTHLALALTSLGDSCQAAGDLVDARDAWRDALDILDELRHPDADDVRAKLHAVESVLR